jgi:hypothetical protein
MLGDSVEEWRDKAKSYRQRAALYRRVIERAERAGRGALSPGWPQIKAILLEMAEEFDREAAEAEERAESE